MYFGEYVTLFCKFLDRLKPCFTDIIVGRVIINAFNYCSDIYDFWMTHQLHTVLHTVPHHYHHIFSEHSLVSNTLKSCTIDARFVKPICMISQCIQMLAFLSSANEVWVGHRNAGHPSFRLSVRLMNAIS